MLVVPCGDVPERTGDDGSARPARPHRRSAGVLEAVLQEAPRDDLVEVVIDPMKLSSYGLQLDQLIQVSALQQPGGGWRDGRPRAVFRQGPA